MPDKERVPLGTAYHATFVREQPFARRIQHARTKTNHPGGIVCGAVGHHGRRRAKSSRWLRERVQEFAWQQGYGAFSVSASVAGTVKRYIENQAEHHKRRSFEDEFLALLKKSGVAYDPKFVFG